jgi:hypothetical protein
MKMRFPRSPALRILLAFWVVIIVGGAAGAAYLQRLGPPAPFVASAKPTQAPAPKPASLVNEAAAATNMAGSQRSAAGQFAGEVRPIPTGIPATVLPANLSGAAEQASQISAPPSKPPTVAATNPGAHTHRPYSPKTKLSSDDGGLY